MDPVRRRSLPFTIPLLCDILDKVCSEIFEVIAPKTYRTFLMPKIQSILIANRGEIALRILRACREEALEAVCIYSPQDRRELYVRYADKAYPLQGETPLSCYLDGQQIIGIAQKAGCQAIHPGYGFLSEDPQFARQVEDAGLIFLGPTPESMKKMGDKVEARKTAQAAGAPLIPGTVEPVKRDTLIEVAKEVGFPLMLKAQGGGGGKGIRIVEKEENLLGAFDRASSEAKTAFGNGELYLEKVIQKPRHVEVQILGNGRGDCIALGERDSSLQRRHQKIMEETPCVFISDETRKALHQAAINVASKVQYRGAGTVEFLVDKDERFYFLEMNTRLQVEHPVTELVFGIDLVLAQIRIGEGHLELPQDLSPKGHAIEIRIVAEDPYARFLPSTGTIQFLNLPGGAGIRLDSSLYEGQEITPYFDPLVAKLIVYGKDREQARRRTLGALEEFEVQGISTNIPYVYTLLETPEIIEGRYHTRFLEEDFTSTVPEINQELVVLSAALFQYTQDQTTLVSQDSSKEGINPWKFFGRVNRIRKRI